MLFSAVILLLLILLLPLPPSFCPILPTLLSASSFFFFSCCTSIVYLVCFLLLLSFCFSLYGSHSIFQTSSFVQLIALCFLLAMCSFSTFVQKRLHDSFARCPFRTCNTTYDSSSPQAGHVTEVLFRLPHAVEDNTHPFRSAVARVQSMLKNTMKLDTSRTSLDPTSNLIVPITKRKGSITRTITSSSSSRGRR